MSPIVKWSAFVAMAGFLFGFDTAVIELRFRGSRQSFTDRFCAQNREAALELPGETHQWNYFPAPI